jgi:uncharacterized protein (TIGR02117 family)
VLALSACIATGPVARPDPADDAVVFVIERGWHSDIGLPADEIEGPLARLKQSLPGLRVLTFGFGERAYLLADDVTLGGMLSALLPSRSALLMTALRASPQAAFGADDVVMLHVSRAGLVRLRARLWQSFERSADGRPVVIRAGPYPGGVFYAGTDTYDALNTCNTWTATLLREAGLPVPTAGVVLVGQVMSVARAIAARQTLPGSRG